MPSTGKLRAFKLMKIAGVVGAATRATRCSSASTAAWPDDKQLKAYLTRLEEAEKRDHRKLGKEQDLFPFPGRSAGRRFWHPGLDDVPGADRLHARGDRVPGSERPGNHGRGAVAPLGHLEKFGENMFMTKTPDERVYAIKPMNCPGHVQIFNQGLRSYRDLPLRFAGVRQGSIVTSRRVLHGLMRVRAFTQDDAHVFVTETNSWRACAVFSCCSRSMAISASTTCR